MSLNNRNLCLMMERKHTDRNIVINKENKNNLPTIYYYDERIPKDKLQLVNYRIKGNYFEIDRVAQAWKIVYQQDAYLVVERPVKAKKSKIKVIYIKKWLLHMIAKSIHLEKLSYLKNALISQRQKCKN